MYPSSHDAKWTADDIPDLTGKIAVVTGANSGIGFAATQALTRKGSHVVMACRNLEKAHEALTKIREGIPDASVEIIQLDLADLSSVRRTYSEQVCTEKTVQTCSKVVQMTFFSSVSSIWEVITVIFTVVGEKEPKNSVYQFDINA